MSVLVTPGRGPSPSRRQKMTRRDSDNDNESAFRLGVPGTRFDTWPLPKRLRVRLQSSAERFVTQTDLDQRLRLAERLQANELERTRAKARAANARVARAAATRSNRVARKRASLESRLVAAETNRRAAMRARLASSRRGMVGAESKSNTVSVDSFERQGAARKIQRAWRVFLPSKGLAGAFFKLRPKKKHASSLEDAFDAFAGAARDGKVLDATRAFLQRVARKINALDFATETAESETETESERVSFSKILSPRVPPRDAETFPARELLCAYVVVGFPDIVLGASGAAELGGELAQSLKATAMGVTQAADLLANVFTRQRDPFGPGASASHDLVTPRVALCRFASAFQAYTESFVSWKRRDAEKLELELTRAAVEMTASALQTCGASTTSNDFPEGSDARAVLEALVRDVCILRGKVKGLGGEAGVQRFDLAVRVARVAAVSMDAELLTQTSRDARDDAEPGRATDLSRAARRVQVREDARAARLAAFAARRVSNTNSSVVDDPNAARTPSESHTNEALMHELLVDPDFRLERGNSESSQSVPSDGTSASSETPQTQTLATRIQTTMITAFWDAVRDGLAKNDVAAAARAVGELGDALAATCPDSCRSEAEAALLLQLTPTVATVSLTRVLQDPITLHANFGTVITDAARMLTRLGAPRRDAPSQESFAQLELSLGQLATSAVAFAANGEHGKARLSVANAVVDALKQMFDTLNNIKLDTGNAGLAALAKLARGKDGAEWALGKFAKRFGIPSLESVGYFEDTQGGDCDATRAAVAAALPGTHAWLGSATATAHRLDANIPTAAFGLNATVSKTNANAIPSTMRSGRGVPSVGFPGNGKEPENTEKHHEETCVTRASSPEGLLRLALCGLVCGEPGTENETENESPGSETTPFPETLEFDKPRVRFLQNSFAKLRARAAVLLASNRFVHRRLRSTALEQGSRPTWQVNVARLDSLLNDETSEVEDIAVEIVAGNGRDTNTDAALVTVTQEIRGLIDPGCSECKKLTAALTEATQVRALLGPLSRSTLENGAARAMAVAAPLARFGFTADADAAVAKDVSFLVERIYNTIGAVTWSVHKPVYNALFRDVVQQDDEI